MFSILYTLLFVAVNIDFSASHTCQSLNEVSVQLHDKKNHTFNQTVSGCIERLKFIDNNDQVITVVKAYVKDQRIPNFWRDTVRNMKYLTTVSFVSCKVGAISPVAFRNVPSLSTVEISHGKLKKIVKEIFTFDLTPRLETLLLNSNEINSIEDQAFYNLTRLKKVDASNNKLEVWKQEWFNNTTSLQIINFQSNKIRSLPQRAFENFPNLREIYFDFNDITDIYPDAFKGLRSLEYLTLSHNRLTVLEEHSFPNTVRINVFAINANYLNYLSNEVLKKLTAVKLIMDYNPWKCPCLERINYWLYIKNGRLFPLVVCGFSKFPICAVPKDSPQICVETVDYELTLRYINTLKNLSVDPTCARLD